METQERSVSVGAVKGWARRGSGRKGTHFQALRILRPWKEELLESESLVCELVGAQGAGIHRKVLRRAESVVAASSPRPLP